MTPEIFRAWINQPSKLQPLHHLHGKFCIAVRDRPNNARLYFTEGDVISMDASPLWISRGSPAGSPA